MILKRGDILFPTDSKFVKPRKNYISGMLIVIKINLDEDEIYFYQLDDHTYYWHYYDWFEDYYKVLQ